MTQGIGLVTVSVEYSSPNVHAPDGSDRKGKIWGDLVPYGLSDLGYNDCKECPWRGGANENTVFAVSHDVTVEGQPLKAGRYGLHFIPGQEECNADYLLEHGCAVKARTLDVLDYKVLELLENPARLDMMRRACGAVARASAGRDVLRHVLDENSARG